MGGRRLLACWGGERSRRTQALSPENGVLNLIHATLLIHGSDRDRTRPEISPTLSSVSCRLIVSLFAVVLFGVVSACGSGGDGSGPAVYGRDSSSPESAAPVTPSSAVALEAGDCAAEADAVSQAISCESDGAVYEFVELANAQGLCPDGKPRSTTAYLLEKSTYTDRQRGCFVLNLKPGKCYMQGQGFPVDYQAVYVPYECKKIPGTAIYRVTERKESNDGKRCGTTKSLGWLTPPRVICARLMNGI